MAACDWRGTHLLHELVHFRGGWLLKVPANVHLRLELLRRAVLVYARQIRTDKLLSAYLLPVVVLLGRRLILNKEEPVFLQVLDWGPHIRLNLKDACEEHFGYTVDVVSVAGRDFDFTLDYHVADLHGVLLMVER